ncbi:MAG TPA: hypothetical protein VFZ95_07160 [Steroidobacteraceae bacterium]
MRNILFSLFAIGVAAVAAMTATTAMLNTPVHPATDVMTQNMQAEQPSAPPSGKPATAPGGPPATPDATPDAAKPASGAAPDAASKDTKDAAGEEDTDKDPYEGIAPEELPPDLQYSADSSVSFPTNI